MQKETQNLLSLLELMLDQHQKNSWSGLGVGTVSGSGLGMGASRSNYSNIINDSVPRNSTNHFQPATGLPAAPLPIQGEMNIYRGICALLHVHMRPNPSWTHNSDRVGHNGGSSVRSLGQGGAGLLQVRRPGSGSSFALDLGQTSGLHQASAAPAARLVNGFQTSATASSPLTPGQRSSLVADFLRGTPRNLPPFDSNLILNRQNSSTTMNRDWTSALVAQLGSIPESRLAMTTDFSARLNLDSWLSRQIQIMKMQHQGQLRSQQQHQQEFRQQLEKKEILKQILASLPSSALITLAESTESIHSNSTILSDIIETGNNNQEDSSIVPPSDHHHSPKNTGPRQHPSVRSGVEIPHEERTDDNENRQEDQSSWNEKFSDLCELMIKNDLHEIPSRFLGRSEGEIDLNNWIELQRKQYHLFREGHTQGLSITPSQIEKLESIGFRSIVKPAVADPSETKNKPSKQKAHVDLWNERYLELKAYKENFGDCLVPERYENNHRLGTWVRTQRKHYKLMKDGKRSSMKSERIERLNSLGFVWTVR
ncbi:hypothetical protein ACHAXS_012999 [Conticribra weissflogii]